jgi:hypothetical protein
MRYFIFVVFLIACSIASFALYAGIQHNPMGEFCKNEDLSTCDFDYIYALIIWLSWFIPFFVLPAAVMIAIKYAIKVLTRRSTRTP